MLKKVYVFPSVLLGLSIAAVSASAAVIRVPESSFIAGSGLITFSEFPINTVNPTYTPAMYGGGAGSPTVTFEGFFRGQSLGTAATCPAGAAVTGCVLGNPTGPLTLDPAAPDTFITTDTSFPTSPTLTGSPQFNGPISMVFSVDVAGVGLQGGFFNAIGGTAIRAYDRNGVLLGAVTNQSMGIEFLGLVTDTGAAQIAGLQFSLVGGEPGGFNIDNLRFGGPGQVVVPPTPGAIPEPGTVSLLLAGGLLGGLLRRRLGGSGSR